MVGSLIGGKEFGNIRFPCVATGLSTVHFLMSQPNEEIDTHTYGSFPE